MSQRLAERIPKRMLMFFNEDQSTSVLNTNLVTQVLEKEGKICDELRLKSTVVCGLWSDVSSSYS